MAQVGAGARLAKIALARALRRLVCRRDVVVTAIPANARRADGAGAPW